LNLLLDAELIAIILQLKTLDAEVQVGLHTHKVV
jgi:hypothetical protein